MRLVHPSGIKVECCDERKREQNRVRAWAEMGRRLQEREASLAHLVVNADRVAQMSERGWTWTQWRDEVVDRTTGKRARYSDLLRGKGLTKMA